MEAPRLVIAVKVLYPGAPLPTRGHAGDAGWDLYCAGDGVEIRSGATALVPTGIALEIPAGWYGQIKSRSSLGARGVVVTAGVIDSGYRGEVKVALINTGEALALKRGDKIAQIVFLPVPDVTIEVADSLGPSSRGDKGFGSTGR
jgi:dUTP pyrophosphatase